VYVDGGQGNFINPDDPEDFGPFSAMQTGWRSVNFPDNFTNLFTEERLRTPFIGVFIWTIVFAFMAVFTSFFLGLLLAIAMDKKFKGRNFYRSILILPYAIPSLMSILIWRGMFNRDFGYINLLLKTIGIGDPDSPINWLDQPWTARAVIIVVNLWLGFPYMYLISTGALQSIPAELKEAASIDGASTWQTFKLITLPLLLQVLSPLLIASFAFNFNNFNIVYLLTGGGPTDETSGQIAGATDILISYAYKTAISNPQNQDFGTASAISMFMFVIVGVLSMWSLRRSKVLEGM
jgi:arabinogalactan oligomer/maltooligosaccharide transport system permease protein